MSAQPLRVAVLASGWTGYNDAALRALAARGVELLAVYEDSSPDTAYRTAAVGEYAEVLTYTGEPAPGEVRARVLAFAPDAVLMHSWHQRDYREAMAALPAGTLRVCWMDNVWRRTPKQVLGRAVSRRYVRGIFDCAMVPSDRTEGFARMLGFGEGEVIRGSLSADSDLFARPARDGATLADHGRFVAALRLVEHKGADVLAEAYRRYRDRCEDPWGLLVAGIGPLHERLAAVPGVELPGFLQPDELAARMDRCSCLVNPAREEPFGVALHEGALSALPMISTYFVGAAPLYVQDGQNGWVVPREDPEALARAMHRMSSLPPERLGEMSQVSRHLGARTSSQGWARNLHEQLVWRLEELRSSPVAAPAAAQSEVLS